MEPLEPAVLDRLRAFNTPTVSNAIEVFDVRPRNEGFMRPEIRCIFPRLGVMVGYAVTLKIQSVTPGGEGSGHSSQRALAGYYEGARAAGHCGGRP